MALPVARANLVNQHGNPELAGQPGLYNAVHEAFDELGQPWEEIEGNLADRVEPIVREPDEPFVDQLIPNEFPFHAAPLEEQAALQAVPHELEVVPQLPAPVPVPHPPIRPAATPGQPDVIRRILDVFKNAIQSFIALIATYIFCMPRAAAVRQQPIAQQQMELPLNLPEGRFQGRLNLDHAGGPGFAEYCAFEFLNDFWGEANPGFTQEQMQRLIDTSLQNGAAKMRAADGGGREEIFPQIVELAINRLGEEQNYSAQLNTLDLHARRNQQHMTAALLRKGEEAHILLVDARNRGAMRYYHFNPHGNPAYVQTQTTPEAMSNYLNETVPIEAAIPFTMRAFTVRPPE